MKLFLPNGSSIDVSGTPAQISEIANKLGVSNPFDPDYYYASESKGMILISEMDTTWLRNAILKKAEEWIKSLHGINNPRTLVRALISGNEDKNWLALLREYINRPEPEERRSRR